MRVIGGYLRGKKVFEPLDKTTRPLKDMVRESIFNILDHSKNEFVKIQKSKVLDLFSGTGSFGIECLSRGAEKVFFFENYLNSLKILKKNLKYLNLESKSKIFEKNSYKIKQIDLVNEKLDLIFLDPPFEDNEINLLIKIIKKIKIVDNNTLIILHRNRKKKEKISDEIKILREKNYGLSKIIFGKIY